MFTICIPNYNYEKYLAITLDSVANQSYQGFEVVVADNCSTDGSVRILKEYQHSIFTENKLKFKINTSNVGFAGNLDQAASLTSNPYMIMLSSDDLIKPDALSSYKLVIDQLGTDKKIVVCSAIDIVDSNGVIIGEQKASAFRFRMWNKKDVDPVLSAKLQADVYRVKPQELLKKVLLHCSNPFNFCATCYSRSLYDITGGYGGGRIINPDKWYHWKIIGNADEVIFIDKPLFQYRWHNLNQTAQQKNSGHLKFLMDEYRNTIEIPDKLLTEASISRKEFNRAFIKYDIYRHGMGEFVKGRWLKSLRVYFFGLSTYPALTFWNVFFPVYTLLLLSTPLGAFVVSQFKKRKESWRNG